MKTVLVAIDGSAHALAAVRQAAALAKALGGAQLELVHVVPPVLLPPTVYADAIRQLEETGLQRAHEVLDAAKVVAQNEGAVADGIVLHGAAAEELNELAKANRVWGVVVAARGHNALSRFMLGSVTDRLVHICEKPVLVVR